MQLVKNAEYVVDESGNRKKVILSYDSYIKMLELIEDLQDSKMIRKTKKEPEISLSDYKRKRNLV